MILIIMYFRVGYMALLFPTCWLSWEALHGPSGYARVVITIILLIVVGSTIASTNLIWCIVTLLFVDLDYMVCAVADLFVSDSHTSIPISTKIGTTRILMAIVPQMRMVWV
jgi:hypothetical protein